MNPTPPSRLVLIFAAAALAFVLFALLMPTPDGGRGGPARPSNETEAKAEALIARSQSVATRFDKLLMSVPKAGGPSHDDVPRLAKPVAELVREHERILAELTALPRAALSSKKATELDSFTEKVRNLHESMAAINEQLQKVEGKKD